MSAKRRKTQGSSSAPAAALGGGSPPLTGCLVFVPVSSLAHGAGQWKIWQRMVPKLLGGAVTQDAAAAGITHVIVPPSGAACLPPALSLDGGSAPAGLWHVTDQWLVHCLTKRRRLPEEGYAPKATSAAAAAGAAAAAAAAGPSRDALPGPPADSQGNELDEEEEEEEEGVQLLLEGVERGRYQQEFERALRLAGLPSRPLLKEEDSLDSRCFQAVSWNLWFSLVCAPERMRAVGLQLAELGYPEILMFQECTHLFLDLFSLQPWYRHYLMLGQPPANVRLFSVVLLRTTQDRCTAIGPLDQLCFKRWDGQMDPALFDWFNLKSVQFELLGTPIRISTARLSHNEFGRQQFAEIDQMLNNQINSRTGLCPNYLIAGDFNWTHKEQLRLGCQGWEPSSSDLFQDVWLQKRSDSKGNTWDTEVCCQKGKKYSKAARLDRMLAHLTDWEPASIKLIGMDPIPGLTREVAIGRGGRRRKEIEVWPSDHMGLAATFVRKQAQQADR